MIEKKEKQEELTKIIKLNVVGLNCPLPLLRIKKQLAKIKTGDEVQINGLTANFHAFLKGWCERNNHSYLGDSNEDNQLHFFIKKG
jgi:TusA-related sulfurtransferase